MSSGWGPQKTGRVPTVVVITMASAMCQQMGDTASKYSHQTHLSTVLY